MGNQIRVSPPGPVDQVAAAARKDGGGKKFPSLFACLFRWSLSVCRIESFPARARAQIPPAHARVYHNPNKKHPSHRAHTHPPFQHAARSGLLLFFFPPSFPPPGFKRFERAQAQHAPQTTKPKKKQKTKNEKQKTKNKTKWEAKACDAYAPLASPPAVKDQSCGPCVASSVSGRGGRPFICVSSTTV